MKHLISKLAIQQLLNSSSLIRHFSLYLKSQKKKMQLVTEKQQNAKVSKQKTFQHKGTCLYQTTDSFQR